jgi:U3 small nucleolar RNA-associated protein 16
LTASNQLNPALTYLMLSKLLTTARTLLDRASQAEEREPQQTAAASTLADAMVTTRRQSGKHVIDGSNDDDSIRIETSGSSRKRQNLSSHSEDSDPIDEEGAGTAAVKKQKILPVRAKDDEMRNKNTRVVVEIPISRFGLEHNEHLNANRERPVKKIATAEDVEEVGGSDAHLSRLEIPDSESDDNDSEVAEGVEQSDLDISSPGQKGPRKDKINIASAAATGALPGVPKPKHKRFDSEESEVMLFSTALEKAESEEESSDDDAPEVVGALEALEQARMKVREAAKAVEE